MSTRTGRCQCGAVTFETAAEPMMTMHCHCIDCQKASGAGHVTFAAFPADSVTISGKTSTFDSAADSGATMTRHFCPTCGSRLFGVTTSFPGMLGITLAAFDDPGAFAPSAAAYGKRRHGWDIVPGDVPSFETLPPMQPDAPAA